MNTAALTTTRKAARQARNAQVDRIADRFGVLYRDRVKLFAEQSKPLFQACKAGCWGPVELRDARKLDELRQIVAGFARDVAVIVQDRALAARRLGGAQGFAAAGVVNVVQERVTAREATHEDTPRATIPALAESSPGLPVANVSIGKRPTARVVIVENGLVWAVQPKHEAVWTLPGGGVDPGEPYDIAAIREAKEEVGFDVEVVESLFDVEEPGRCGACRALVDMKFLEPGHPGCHRRYFHARRVGNEPAPTITDTDEIAKVMLVSTTSLNDPHDRIAAAQVVADLGDDPTRHRDAFRTPDDME